MNMTMMKECIHKKSFTYSPTYTNLYFLVSIYVIYNLSIFWVFSASHSHQDQQESFPLNGLLLIENQASPPHTLKDIDALIPRTNQESCPQNHIITHPSHNGNGNGNGNANNDASSDEHNYPIYYPPPIAPYAIKNNSTTSIFRFAHQPRYGKHRCNKNAVMAFAHGYQLPELIHFMTSLWKTGYDGDLVIGVGTNLTQETRSFLEYNSGIRPGLVVYEIPLSCQRKDSCQIVNLLEQADTTTATTSTMSTTSDWTPLSDVRPHRRVSVLRYEYYWAWTTRYHPESLIFFVDARDVYFQRDPMKVLADTANPTIGNTSTPTTAITTANKNGTLIFFQEAIKISESKANYKWIQNTYSTKLKEQMGPLMVICSGATLGSQPAIEIYARAMVYEFDKTKCRRCANKHDQCFHNYLIHQNQLVGANDGGVSNVILHAQGEGGLVNTIGMVSKSNDGKSLQQLGLVHPESREILENDRQTVSAVVHMYDRDEMMKGWIDQQIEQELTHQRQLIS